MIGRGQHTAIGTAGEAIEGHPAGHTHLKADANSSLASSTSVLFEGATAAATCRPLWVEELPDIVVELLLLLRWWAAVAVVVAGAAAVVLALANVAMMLFRHVWSLFRMAQRHAVSGNLSWQSHARANPGAPSEWSAPTATTATAAITRTASGTSSASSNRQQHRHQHRRQHRRQQQQQQQSRITLPCCVSAPQFLDSGEERALRGQDPGRDAEHDEGEDGV